MDRDRLVAWLAIPIYGIGISPTRPAAASAFAPKLRLDGTAVGCGDWLGSRFIIKSIYNSSSV
jgi:hypothetical protein